STAIATSTWRSWTRTPTRSACCATAARVLEARPDQRRRRPHMTANESRPANRLAGTTSPYLLQHAHNPVDWYPWGDEALARARAEDRPILLSVGYAACHWCHVMERESFEDPETAEAMNRD